MNSFIEFLNIQTGTFLANLFQRSLWEKSCNKISCIFKVKKDYFPKDPIISNFKVIRNHNLIVSFYERMHQFNKKDAINI